MKIVLILCLSFFLFFSCVNTDAPVAVDQGNSIRIENPTRYNVYFDQDQQIKKNTSGMVTLSIESGTLSRGFDIWYEILLSNTVPIFCKGDHRTIREKQNSLTITEPKITEIYGVFLAIRNNADSAITFNTGGTVNPSIEQRGSPAAGNYLARTDRREFSPGQTAVFDISSDSGRENYTVQESRKSTRLVLPQPLLKNYLYTIDYNADGCTLSDVRPLHRIGESAWTKTIPGIIDKNVRKHLPLVAADGQIHLFAPANHGLIRRTFNSAGNAGPDINSGESFSINSAVKAGDGFLVVGYTESTNGNRQPIARIVGADGVTRRMLNPSNNYGSASFWTAAQKDTATWLLAGDGGGKTAYAGLVRDNGSALITVWELGRDLFDAKTTQERIKCGEIVSAAYDSGRDRWLVTGENIEDDSMKNSIVGSYIAIINSTGVVQKADTSFRGMSFYKILVDLNGNCYAAGEEHKGKETLAVLVKYNAEAKELWRLSVQPGANSYYQDAVLDSANNRIVLAGTMEVADEQGQGGIPFIEAVDMEQGTLLWREKLVNPALTELKGTNLATTIAMAPDYGFVLALSGITKTGYIGTPFVIVRVNSQGKTIK